MSIPSRYRGSSKARAEAVRSAVASARLAEPNLTPVTLAVFDDYASCAIEVDEMMERGLGMYGTGAHPSTTTKGPGG